MSAKYFHSVCFTFLIALFLIGTASAQPGFPCHFYGDVIINGAPAADGVVVDARVSGTSVALTTTLGGTYGEGDDVFYVPNPQNNMDGKTVEFYVQNIKAADHVFSSLDGVVELDLSITMDVPPQNTGPGGGGGYVPSGDDDDEEEENPEEVTCTEDWICTDWTECVNGKQTRTCADVNRCGTTEDKPELMQSCLTPAEGACEPGEVVCQGNTLSSCSSDGSSWIPLEECTYGCLDGKCTGFGLEGLITGMTPAVGGVAGIVVVALLLLYVFRIRKKK